MRGKKRFQFFTVEDIGYGQRAYKNENGLLILFLLNENSVIFWDFGLPFFQTFLPRLNLETTFTSIHPSF